MVLQHPGKLRYFQQETNKNKQSVHILCPMGYGHWVSKWWTSSEPEPQTVADVNALKGLLFLRWMLCIHSLITANKQVIVKSYGTSCQQVSMVENQTASRKSRKNEKTNLIWLACFIACQAQIISFKTSHYNSSNIGDWSCHGSGLVWVRQFSVAPELTSPSANPSTLNQG
jgi:hypothetical protein